MVMRLFFCGGEVDSYRRLLEDYGHTTIAMSYIGLARRVRFRKPWSAADRFGPDTQILLDSGAYSLNKEGASVTAEEATAHAIDYMAFVTANISRVNLVTEFDALALGEDWMRGTREDFYSGLGDKFIPVWHSLSGLPELYALADRYGRAGILQDDADDDDYETVLGQLAASGVRLHGMGMTRIRAMRQIGWDSVSSTSWLSPIKYGDLIIWDANRLHRFPRTRSEHGLKSYAGKLAAQGFDVDAINAGQTPEMLRLSAWSWSQYVRWLNDSSPGGDTAEPAPGSPRPQAAVPAVRPEPREPVMLPLITAEHRAAADDQPAEELLSASGTTLMQCSACYIRRECPEFREGAACAYKIPVQVETGNQLRALLNTIIRIQSQRALIMTMMEQAKGGYADAATGTEIDRLARLIRLRSDAEKTTFSLQVTASGPAPQLGYLSSVFGKDAGDRATALPAPVTAADILGTVVDAEIVP